MRQELGRDWCQRAKAEVVLQREATLRMDGLRVVVTRCVFPSTDVVCRVSLHLEFFDRFPLWFRRRYGCRRM